jgi:predicted PurR-regulated permease PerM
LGARDGVFISATRSGRGIDLGTRSDLLPAYRLLWQEITLIAFGVLVIGLVDNILRPIRVGKDTQIPDYVILISTLGGMVLFGLNGFVIGPVIAAIFIAAWDLFSSAKEAPRV